MTAADANAPVGAGPGAGPWGGAQPWPNWLHGFRPDQEQALADVLGAFGGGARVVFLDAPTGSGKTLVAEMVRRALEVPSVYMCSSRQLQAQFLSDYPYAQLLEGRANYKTVNMPWPAYSCADCMGEGCPWCPSREACPYAAAKQHALGAPLAVLNTAYFLAEANSQGAFGMKTARSTGEVTRLPLVVADECDTLEAALMGYIEVRVPGRVLAEVGVQVPVKGARAATVERWRSDVLVPALKDKVRAMGGEEGQGAGLGVEQARELLRYRRLIRQVSQVDLASEGEGDDRAEVWGDWVRAYEQSRGGEPFVLKPVVVNKWGSRVLWRHAQRWLCMSATVVSAGEQAESLGLEQARVPWEVVHVPMRFPARNRQVVIKPVANMTRAAAAEEWPKLAAGLKVVLARYPTENTLVHTVSYKLAEYLEESLLGCGELAGRALHSYHGAVGRDEVVQAFRAGGGVLLAPSLERGIDLPGDLCRVVVVAKLPYPSLGDRAVAARLGRPGGRLWYSAMVARSLVQMTGRGVRDEDDWAVSWVLDRQFSGWWASGGQRLLPRWWREAVTAQAPPREVA